ncbi:TonB family protein [Carboxylicivirga marina]|uniref:TonB family protein n=1 Tax=Carboxylicivirga marina TaxID=2800988 RepID=UPI00259300E6|nr:TonB family protein [uncultured Carboxylicivirga sp.]
MKNHYLRPLLIVLSFVSIHSSIAQINWEVWNEAESLYQNKQYAAALNYFSKIEKENPYYGNTYVRKSYANYHLKNYKDALLELEKAYVYKPLDSQYFYMKGQFLDKNEEFDKALFYFDLLISMEPNNARYRNYRGNIHLESQHFKSAITDYNFVLARDPKKYSLYFSRGAAKFNLKMKREACLDWLYAKEHNKSCKNYFFYKCNNEDLRPITHPKFPIENIEMPVCDVGVDSSVVNFISLELNYPLKALFNEEEGMVLVQFDISEDAQLENIKVLHSVTPELDAEAIRLVNLTSGKWVKPATKNGNAIRSSHVLPISFRIEQLNFTEQSLLERLKGDDVSDNKKIIQSCADYLLINPFAYDVFLKRQEALMALGLNDQKNYKSIYKKLRSSSTFLHTEIISYSKCAKLYFNEEWELTSPKYACYYRLAQLENGLRIEGAYRDFLMDGSLYSSGELNYGKKDGAFQFFYPNGQLKSEYLFDNDIPLGLWKFYFDDGKSKHLVEIKDHSFNVISSFNEDGRQTVEKSTGNWEYQVPIYNHSDTLNVTGELQNMLWVGEWELKLSDNFKLVEKYKKGKYISGEYTENGKTVPLKIAQIKPSFLVPGEILKASKLELDPKIRRSTYSNMLDNYRFEYVTNL